MGRSLNGYTDEWMDDGWMDEEFLCLFNWFIAFPKECSLKIIFSPLLFWLSPWIMRYCL